MPLIRSLFEALRWASVLTIGSVALQRDVSVQALDCVHSRTIKSLYDFPHPPRLHWNDAAVGYGSIVGSQGSNQSSFDIALWHPRTIEYGDLAKVATLQEGRLEVVHHPALGTKPVLVKRAALPEYIESVSRETEFYRLLDGLDVTPLFLGHVTEVGVITGFLAEYVEPQQQQQQQTKEERLRLRASGTEACLSALRRMHGRGVAHGDAHGGNCLVRGDGSAVLVDFELAEENSSMEEFERDLWVMKYSRDADDSN